MTQQIATLLDERVSPAGVIVVVEARHLCMEMRGVSTPGVSTTTIAVRGTLGDETLRTIARELVDTVRKNVTIDWTVRESARAKIWVMVRRILKMHGYGQAPGRCCGNHVPGGSM